MSTDKDYQRAPTPGLLQPRVRHDRWTRTNSRPSSSTSNKQLMKRMWAICKSTTTTGHTIFRPLELMNLTRKTVACRAVEWRSPSMTISRSRERARATRCHGRSDTQHQRQRSAEAIKVAAAHQWFLGHLPRSRHAATPLGASPFVRASAMRLFLLATATRRTAAKTKLDDRHSLRS